VERAKIRKSLLLLATEEKAIAQRETDEQAEEGALRRKSLEELKAKFSKFISWYKKASSIVLEY
jgi:hypothetical protein